MSIIHTRVVSVCVVAVLVVVEGVVVDDCDGSQILNRQNALPIKREDQLLHNKTFLSLLILVVPYCGLSIPQY